MVRRHVTNLIQEFKKSQKPSQEEADFAIGKGKRIRVEWKGTAKFMLDIGFCWRALFHL